MKYCKYCGSEISQTYKVCPNCNKELTKTNKTLQTFIKVIMVIQIISNILMICFTAFLLFSIELMLETTFIFVILLYFGGFSLISLIWLFPMCIYYFVRTKKNKNVGIAFKICCLLLGFFIPGILMLCDDV